MKHEKNSTIRYYQQHAEKLSQRYERAEVADLHRRLLDTFSPGAQLLEIGCGSGREAAYLCGQGYEVQGIDPAPAMIDRALCLHPQLEGRLFQGALPDELPAALLEHEHYNGIYAVASLMHLLQEQLHPTFEHLHQLLTQAGKLLFSVPLSRPGLDESGYDEKGRYYLLLASDEWIDQAKSAGFHSISSATTGDGLGREAITWLTCVVEK
ncbi:MAG: class I SAM-dependent methyltransferase [Spirochaetia bacterium]|nr:class I SAM-dependent methyltransferase [Spirochaetia bacterium]